MPALQERQKLSFLIDLLGNANFDVRPIKAEDENLGIADQQTADNFIPGHGVGGSGESGECRAGKHSAQSRQS